MAWGKGKLFAIVVCGLTCLGVQSRAQNALPFEVSNPKHQHWPAEEAGRIYTSACRLAARAESGEPARLPSKFVLVLGAKANQMIRDGENAEIHLKKWDPGRFAEAMVLLSLRQAVKSEDVIQMAHEVLNTAEATVTVKELREEK